MRQIGTLPTESEASRFAAYLVTQDVSAHAENEPDGWAIWVRDENQVEKAREELAHFREHPQDDRYEGVEREAESLLRRRVKRHEQAHKNVVEMRDQWSQGRGRRTPLVFILIVASILVTIWTNFGKKNEAVAHLFFLSTARPNDEVNRLAESDPLVDVRSGEVWRVITPIFVHLSIWHLIFNMYWTYVLGSQFEVLRGTFRFAVFVLLTAAVSNIAQAVISNPLGGGMSGVGYGLFGYVWMKTLFQPTAGFHLAPGVAMLFIIWFFVCLSGVLGPVGNTAHLAGFGVGVAVGYAPVLFKSKPGR